MYSVLHPMSEKLFPRILEATTSAIIFAAIYRLLLSCHTDKDGVFHDCRSAICSKSSNFNQGHSEAWDRVVRGQTGHSSKKK